MPRRRRAVHARRRRRPPPGTLEIQTARSQTNSSSLAAPRQNVVFELEWPWGATRPTRSLSNSAESRDSRTLQDGTQSDSTTRRRSGRRSLTG